MYWQLYADNSPKIECSTPISTYSCFSSISLANKIANIARNHRQRGELATGQITILFFFFFRSFFSSQGSAIPAEMITMIQAREDENLSWLVHLLFRF